VACTDWQLFLNRWGPFSIALRTVSVRQANRFSGLEARAFVRRPVGSVTSAIRLLASPAQQLAPGRCSFFGKPRHLLRGLRSTNEDRS
jgi:hypothetical protein